LRGSLLRLPNRLNLRQRISFLRQTLPTPRISEAVSSLALDFSAEGADIMARNPAVIRFMGRDSGILVLIKLIQMQMSAGDSEKGLSCTDIGVRFGISRSHVRGLLEEAAQHGDVSLSGGRPVALQPSILQAFDRFLADAMSGHDLLYKFARERMAKEVRRPNS
jgi:hypothetical protein